MPKWTPAGDGPGFELTEILQPLKAYKDRLTIVSGLSHALAYGSGATANHNRSTAAFLSGAFAKVGAQPQLGVTIDQVAAQKIGQDTPIPSLELMIEESSVNCGDGLSCAYRDTMAWQGPSSPLPMQNNPQVVFERLFGDGATAELRADAAAAVAQPARLGARRSRVAAARRCRPPTARAWIATCPTCARSSAASSRPASRCPTRRWRCRRRRPASRATSRSTSS